MYTLSCKDMGVPTCGFVAEGETKEEVMKTINEHVMKAHPDKAKEMGEKYTKEESEKMMMEKMKEK